MRCFTYIFVPSLGNLVHLLHLEHISLWTSRVSSAQEVHVALGHSGRLICGVSASVQALWTLVMLPEPARDLVAVCVVGCVPSGKHWPPTLCWVLWPLQIQVDMGTRQRLCLRELTFQVGVRRGGFASTY